eukprot:63053-Chlamydomonas_euryale.AAC.2
MPWQLCASSSSTAGAKHAHRPEGFFCRSCVGHAHRSGELQGSGTGVYTGTQVHRPEGLLCQPCAGYAHRSKRSTPPKQDEHAHQA